MEKILSLDSTYLLTILIQDKNAFFIMTSLGLPLEYQVLPEFFDAWNINDQTDINNSMIEKILKDYDIQTVLDRTCGTGSQVFFLLDRGYECIGRDFSPELIKIAQRKAITKGYDPHLFSEQDMRDVQKGQFDAVITIFNAIGHVTKEDFAQTLRNIGQNLKDGGIYVFDILNAQAMTQEIVQNLACQAHKKIQDTNFLSGQCSTFDPHNQILTSYDTYLIQKNADKPQIFQNEFSLQLYSSQELRDLLNENGFETLKQCDWEGHDIIPDKTLSIISIARKKS